MGSKEKLANEIEDIFRIAKYIYGKSDSVDWMKEAAEKTTTFLESKSKKEAEDVVIKIIEAVSSEYRGAVELDERYGLGEIIETIRSTAFGKEGEG